MVCAFAIVVNAIQDFELEISSIDKIIVELQAPIDTWQNFSKDNRERETKDSSFDFFTLSLQWPGSVCKHLSPCELPKNAKNEFTIHGLWPDRKNSAYPQKCHSAAGEFDAAQIQNLFPLLREFWTDYKPNSEPSFWAHEWNKHGTCASILPNLATPSQYFKATMNLVQSLKISHVLARHNIVAHATTLYETSQVKEVLKKELGGTPQISCGVDGSINELRLCVSKDLKVFDCAHALNGKGECTKLILPPVH